MLPLQVLVHGSCIAVMSHFHTAKLTEGRVFRSLLKVFPHLSWTWARFLLSLFSGWVVLTECSYLYSVVGCMRCFDAHFFKQKYLHNRLRQLCWRVILAPIIMHSLNLLIYAVLLFINISSLHVIAKSFIYYEIVSCIALCVNVCSRKRRGINTGLVQLLWTVACSALTWPV